MSEDAYARAGVSQGDADAAVASLVSALAAAAPRRAARCSPAATTRTWSASTTATGIALSTDGVGTKLVVAEQLGRWDTVGIDCVAMNVNDVVCVGAEPLAMVDYLAVDRADPEVAGAIGTGLGRGAELAGIEIVGGELAQLGELINGLDLAGACFGLVALDSLVTGASIEPGDPVIGLPSSGLHSNGYTLARSALAEIPSMTSASAAPSATSCSSRPRSTSSRSSSCSAPSSTSAASPTSPRAAWTTCCGWRPRSATRSTIRCRSRRSSR